VVICFGTAGGAQGCIVRIALSPTSCWKLTEKGDAGTHIVSLAEQGAFVLP